jgi:ADP-ribosylglycohydrolase
MQREHITAQRQSQQAAHRIRTPAPETDRGRTGLVPSKQDTAIRNGNRSGGNGALMRTVYPGLFYHQELEAVDK